MSMHDHVAILGGDAREVQIAKRLQAIGAEVSIFGAPATPDLDSCVKPSAKAAVEPANWIVCAVPGLGPGDTAYAPAVVPPIVLDDELLGASCIHRGGLVLGQLTKTLEDRVKRLGIRVFEMKDDRALMTAHATAVAEAVMQLLIEITDQVLRSYSILVIGYGATGTAITDYLLAAKCDVQVTARSPASLARAHQLGARPVPYGGRVTVMKDADIVINTVPASDAIPDHAHKFLAARPVIDIASPPGGLDHEAANEAGIQVIWARGLTGKRAPVTAGDAQFDFLFAVMKSMAGQER